ncbi:endoglucanase-like protein [Roseateles sp. DAIF2]|uniref:glycoside hydrolase family 9 protein n=1 Tax=Roseateles sp. DAIF2 TaxID=2714952 RepID=UPI0018A321A9|nr:glycoside hydrolase family 9 protein [Roseateles sp. DAIF2]QPF72605.1 endoglucanase-like protein [Roseateles sp. DAIF2]
MKFLHNHLGYAPAAHKCALLQATTSPATEDFRLLDPDGGQARWRGRLQPLGGVPGWRDWRYWAADFSELQAPGRYRLQLEGAESHCISAPFAIADSIYDGQLLSDLLHYFKSQRCTGLFDRADRDCPVLGEAQRLDLRGGWYDASGDTSKYLSHLSYAQHMNPQQTPQLVWNLLAGRDAAPAAPLWMDERMVDEALHGADFLCRMQQPDGSFCMTVFDRWSKDVAQRQVCSYSTQQGILSTRYRAGFRQGAGASIAALARASRLPRDGEFERARYLQAAELGFAHLQAQGLAYLDDGRENIIDDYCALLAATELHAASGAAGHAEAAAQRAQRLLARQDAAGFFWADDARTRSFFHAAEAGLPYVALLRWLEICPEAPGAPAARAGLRRGLAQELTLTHEQGVNPFGYPRQWVQMPQQPGRVQFFFPHENESGYWWQGENARLASLAAAARWAGKTLDLPAPLDAQAERYAQDALHWIFGRNPFDACMMQGQGHNNPRYEPGYWNAPGGVCNGITAGLDDEAGIDFRMPWETEPRHSWRWSEQWLPHGAWLFLALALQ